MALLSVLALPPVQTTIQNGERSLWRRAGSGILQTVLVLWAGALVVYFLYREGLINWSVLEQPAQGGWFRQMGLPDPRFEPSTRPDGFVTILRNTFTRSYNWNWENAPFGSLGLALLMIFCYIALGWLLLDCMRVYFPRTARLCLALVVGCTVAGIVFELIAMAHLLHHLTVASTWVIMLVAVFSARSRLRRTWLKPEHAPGGSFLTPVAQSGMATDYFQIAYAAPYSLAGKVLLWLIWLLVGLISGVLFLHAVGLPETYWDSLILYMGYAQLMFLEHSFPFKAVGQVGIGLGANYPHLYPVLTAQTAAAFGYWSDSFAQLLPPLAGLASTLLVYHLALLVLRERLPAAAIALLYRSIPYNHSYTQFASDYAIAILFAAAFLYLCARYVDDARPGYRWLMLLVAAGAVHINYLMLVLWPIAVVVILVAHVRWPVLPQEKKAREEHAELLLEAPVELHPPAFLSDPARPNLRGLLGLREFWISLGITALLASPWYIRNTMLTGNPVYAFFYNFFTASVRVNPEVMQSAEVEWILNGDGLRGAGRTLGEKLRNSWSYFVTGPQHWKLSPVLMPFVMPGVILAGIFLLRIGSRKAAFNLPSYAVAVRFALPALLYFFGLWFYAYAVADFYLYQIIVILPAFGFFMAYVFRACRSRAARIILYALALLVGFAPGLVMALMGFKLKKTGVYVGMPAPQMDVTALRRLFMDRALFYRMEFGGDMEALNFVNSLPEGTVVLTHENRHLLLNPAIRIVHLDDWEVQKTYRQPAAERLRLLDELGIEYYLYVPNEDKHQVNALVGMDELIGLGHFKLVTDTPASGVSSPELVQHKNIPQDRNALYRRAK